MRCLLAVAVLGLALVGGCGASTPGAKVLGESVERPSVAGVVRRDGTPVAGARVLLGDTGRVEVTGASGSYRFEAVDATAYRLTVLHGGDDTPVCDAKGACVTTRSARHAVVDIAVDGGPVVADIDL